MALFGYFKQRDGLPEPKGLLSLAVPSCAISLSTANHEVREATTSGKKRGPYMKEQKSSVK